MNKYLTFKSTFTNKFCGLYTCWTLTDNPRWLAHRNGPRLSSPDEGRRLQVVYLSLRGMEPKLINCSWLCADPARVSAPWSCHSYGGQVPYWDHQAALQGASPWVAQPGPRRRWQTPGASLSYVCTVLLLSPPQPSSPAPSHIESRLCVHPHLH